MPGKLYMPSTRFERTTNLIANQIVDPDRVMAEYQKLPVNAKAAVKKFTKTERLLFDYFKKHMQETLHYDAVNKPLSECTREEAYALISNADVEVEAWQKLDDYAPHQFEKAVKKLCKNPYDFQQNEIRKKLMIGEAMQKVTGIYKNAVQEAKATLETIVSSLKDIRPISNRVLRQATAREEYTTRANEVLQSVGIDKNFFRLNDDYLALLAKAEDKNAVLTAKEQQILSDYKQIEDVVMEQLKSNKFAKQTYRDAKKMALGMEKLRRESLAERAKMIEYNNAVIKANDMEFEYDLIGQFPGKILK